jgi:hypothetical protein
MSRKTLITLITIVVIIVGGALVVAAQDDDTPTPPYSFGWIHPDNNAEFQHGMMWGGSAMQRGFGHDMMGDDESMMSTVAEILGLEPEALVAALNDGQTLAEVAEAQGINLDAVYAAMFAQAELHMADFVEAGTITQEQSDAHLTWMRENISNMPMFTDGGFGYLMGQSGSGHGMMGPGGGRFDR